MQKGAHSKLPSAPSSSWTLTVPEGGALLYVGLAGVPTGSVVPGMRYVSRVSVFEGLQHKTSVSCCITVSALPRCSQEQT